MRNLEERLNRLVLTEFALPTAMVTKYRDSVETSLGRHASIREGGGFLRLSSLGKPCVVQAMDVIELPSLPVRPMPINVTLLLHFGDVFEGAAHVLFDLAGYDILDHNNDTIKHGTDGHGGYIEYQGIKGHSDFILKDRVNPKSEPFVCEIKTANDRYFNSFAKEQTDERGYLTQLSVYTEALGLDGCWLFYNKNTSQLSVHNLDPVGKRDVLVRLDNILPVLKNIKTWEDLLRAFADNKIKAPPPVPEVFKRRETGLHLVPKSMRYFDFTPCFYRIVTEPNGYDKDTNYVVEVYDTPKHPSEVFGHG